MTSSNTQHSLATFVLSLAVTLAFALLVAACGGVEGDEAYAGDEYSEEYSSDLATTEDAASAAHGIDHEPLPGTTNIVVDNNTPAADPCRDVAGESGLELHLCQNCIATGGSWDSTWWIFGCIQN